MLEAGTMTAGRRCCKERRALSQRATYDWDGPEQVGKTVTEGGVTTSQTQMEYDVAGRLSKVTITTYSGGQASSIVTQAFTYDADGIKVTQTETVDPDADGNVDSSTSTEYLNDKQNHTGYSQVLEERVDDGTQTRTTTYTIGHDVIAQFSAAVGALVLLTDAHGSTRAVADAAAQVQQQYLYDAYGTLLNMQPANALTSLLYSGEQFNPVAGLQYLRARWYDPSTGRFTRMDPYGGNVQDPLGLHKYTYANGNPVTGVDPTGLFAALCELAVTTGIRAGLAAALICGGVSASLGGNFARSFVNGLVAGFSLGVAWATPGLSFAEVLAKGIAGGVINVIGEALARYALSKPFGYAELWDEFLHGFAWAAASAVAGEVDKLRIFKGKDQEVLDKVSAAFSVATVSAMADVIREFASGERKASPLGIGQAIWHIVLEGFSAALTTVVWTAGTSDWKPALEKFLSASGAEMAQLVASVPIMGPIEFYPKVVTGGT
jgi:RHS repeat-associated protein